MTELILNENWEEQFEDGSSLGELLKLRREMDGLTLKEFEAITGISYSLASKYGNNSKKMSASHERIVAAYIGGYFDEHIRDFKQAKYQKLLEIYEKKLQ